MNKSTVTTRENQSYRTKNNSSFFNGNNPILARAMVNDSIAPKVNCKYKVNPNDPISARAMENEYARKTNTVTIVRKHSSANN